MKSSLLSVLSLFSITLLNAQQPSFPTGGFGRQQATAVVGKIAGQLVDSVTMKPVEFATIVLTNPQGGKDVNGGLSDESGVFKLTEVKTGKYILEVAFLGYETKTIAGIETTPEKPDLDLGKVFLIPAGINLDEVTVTGEAALIENKIDKMVYNAEKDVSTSGGDASEVLRRVPMLSVDLEGNVSLRGSNNVQILINGRPSTLFAANIADALKTIPADQIKSVEVITAPTARYDGEGSAGIINIITKKKTAEGITGSANLSVGTRQNNGVLNLNVVRGRFGINGNGNAFWSWPREGSFDFYREDGTPGNLRILRQGGPSKTATVGYNGSVGAFYDFNAYNNLTTNLRFNGFGFDRSGITNGSFTSPDGSALTFIRDNDVQTLRSGFDWTTDYKKTFKTPEKELVFAFQLSGTGSDQENTTLQTSESPIYQRNEINNNDGLNLEYTLQTDYIHPFNELIKLETGAKAVIRVIDSDYELKRFDQTSQTYVPVSGASNIFYYDQDVYAGYASLHIKIGKKNGLVAGARYEHTSLGGEFDREFPGFSNAYDNILPSIILSRTLKGFSNVRLSYSQRIQRPSLRYINPYTENSDPNNITVGNPSLEPELVEQYELSYNTFVKGIGLFFSSYYRRTTDIIESYLEIDDDQTTSTTTFLNIGKDRSVGVNLFASATLFKIWVLRGGFNIFTYNVESTAEGIDLSNEAVLWNGNLNSTINLKKDWKIELFGFFRSNQQTLQGYSPSFSMFSAGVRKEFSKQFSVGIRIIEPFQENKPFPSELRGENFFQRSEALVPFRSFGISLNYSFGKLNFNNPRNSRIRNDDLKQEGDRNF